MNRFVTTTAIAALVALTSVAANAADIRAGDVYSARELRTANLNASDIVEFAPRDQVQVRAGDVYSAHDLVTAGLNANDVLSVSNFTSNVQPRDLSNSWRADR